MREIKFFHFSNNGTITLIDTLDRAINKMHEEGYIWLDYCEPQKEDLYPLIELLGIHPLALEDCLDEFQIPKVEDYPNHLFILFNAYQYVNKVLHIQEVDFILSDSFLITVNGQNASGKPVLHEILKEVQLDIESVKNGPAFLAHTLLDWIVDKKFVAIEALEDDLDSVEDQVLSDIDHFSPAELVRLRRELLSLRKSLFHEREILVKICRKDSQYIPEKSIYQFRDIYDHLAKFFELTESARDLVTGLMEMYLSILNNKMTQAANRTNEIVRRLTFITTIFMPLTLLAGIGGMSEWTMMTGPENWKISYPIFLMIMAVLGVVNFYLLKWLERKDR